MATRDVVFQYRRDSASDWSSKNPTLKNGEPGVETDTKSFKIGDGVTPWNTLPYFLNEEGIVVLIEEYLAGLGGGGTEPAVLAHINDALPHPVYDDGPSLSLLYENAKV